MAEPWGVPVIELTLGERRAIAEIVAEPKARLELREDGFWTVPSVSVFPGTVIPRWWASGDVIERLHGKGLLKRGQAGEGGRKTVILTETGLALARELGLGVQAESASGGSGSAGE